MYLGQTKAGLHADFVETLVLLQNVRQGQSGGGSWELLQGKDGLNLKHQKKSMEASQMISYQQSLGGMSNNVEPRP